MVQVILKLCYELLVQIQDIEVDQLVYDDVDDYNKEYYIQNKLQRFVDCYYLLNFFFCCFIYLGFVMLMCKMWLMFGVIRFIWVERSFLMYLWICFVIYFCFVSCQFKIQWQDIYVFYMICWFWDLDFWNELNNGWVFMFFDFGCIGWIVWMDVMEMMKVNKWGMVVVGSIVCYCCRVQMFYCFELCIWIVGWDDKFFYYE